MTPTEKSIKNLIRWARYRARQRGLIFTLTEEDIVIPHYCPVLGIPLVFGTDTPSDHSPSLDRADPLQGYTKRNTIVVSYRANRLKSDASAEELMKLARFYAAFSHAQTYLQGDEIESHDDVLGADEERPEEPLQPLHAEPAA